VRNIHSAFHYGFVPGVLHAGLTSFVTKGHEPWTLKNTIPDSQVSEYHTYYSSLSSFHRKCVVRSI
jgi:hypothetical protein